MNTNYAGFWQRFLALIIDGIIIGIIRSLIIVPILVAMGIGVASEAQSFDSDDPSSLIPALGMIAAFAGVAMIISTIIWVFYYTLMESSKYQATVGKLALGIIVTDVSGNKLDFSKALARNVSKILSGMVMCIGFLIAAFTEKKQALHDLIASTLVVKKPG